MSASERARLIFALCFPVGAIAHFGWLAKHGWLYHGPAPAWAVWFWYGLCAVDFAVCWLMLKRPRAGLVAALATMAFSLWVNWTFFPTFEFGFNYVLVGLTAFGAALALAAPWLWRTAPR